jgi:hypothetical protein
MHMGKPGKPFPGVTDDIAERFPVPLARLGKGGVGGVAENQLFSDINAERMPAGFYLIQYLTP